MPAVRPYPVPSRSPMAGLRRRRLGFPQVLAQSVAAVAPAAAMATSPLLVLAAVGTLPVWTFALATVVVVVVGYCVGQFSRRMAAAGGIYSFTAKGLGPAPAVAAGWSLLIGYAAVAMSGLLGVGLFFPAVFGASSGLVSGLVTAAAGLAVLGLMRRGIGVSARVSLVLELASIALITTVLAVLLVSEAPRADLGRLVTGSTSLTSAAVAVMLAVTAFVGFESATTLGVEARRPYLAVTRAVLWTPPVLGAVYLFAAGTLSIGVQGAPAGVLDSATPLPALMAVHGLGWLAPLVNAAVASSFFACAVASCNALVRVVLCMGREGILPAALGRAHRRFGTPHVAILASLPVVTAVPVGLLLAGVGRRTALLDLLTLSADGYALAYVLVCTAAPVFLHRIGELTRAAAATGITGAALLAAVLWQAVVVPARSATPVAAIFLGLLAVGLAYVGWLLRCAPERLARVGLYDEASAVDVLPDPFGPEPVDR